MHRAHLSALFLALFFARHAIEASSNLWGDETSRTSNATRPNVVLILADDLGWTDLACYGSDLHETPSLDHLAATGMRFTQNYSACTVCSPTRAALMTGKYPARLHITDWIPGAMPDNPKLLVPDWTKHLPMEEHTMAEVFQAAGYKRRALENGISVPLTSIQKNMDSISTSLEPTNLNHPPTLPLGKSLPCAKVLQVNISRIDSQTKR